MNIEKIFRNVGWILRWQTVWIILRSRVTMQHQIYILVNIWLVNLCPAKTHPFKFSEVVCSTTQRRFMMSWLLIFWVIEKPRRHQHRFLNTILIWPTKEPNKQWKMMHWKALTRQPSSVTKLIIYMNDLCPCLTYKLHCPYQTIYIFIKLFLEELDLSMIIYCLTAIKRTSQSMMFLLFLVMISIFQASACSHHSFLCSATSKLLYY